MWFSESPEPSLGYGWVLTFALRLAEDGGVVAKIF
jgi:hypothetical protein